MALGKFPHEIDAMPLYDFYECMVAEGIEPFGDRRGDIQAGIVAAMIANVNRGRNAKPFSPMDMIPKWDPEPERKRQSQEEQLEIFLAIQKIQNARCGVS